MFKLLKRIAAFIGIALLILVAVITYNTFMYAPDVSEIAERTELDVDVEKAARDLSNAIQYNTDSSNPELPDFDLFLEFLQQTYPSVHATMERTMIAGQTPLYKWPGTNSSNGSVLLAAHYDVVPALADSLDRWDQPPFSGKIIDGHVWGRGALDNKGALIAILAAAETLINQGFQPSRTVYFSFGHDEEVGGEGAKAVAEHLKANNIRLDWALDEGSFVLEGIIPGLETPVASINLAEKGYLTLELVAKGAGGHSALPPKVTAVGRLATAITRLQANPVPGGLTGVSEQFFDHLGRHFSFGRRVVFANRWLFDPLLEKLLSDSAPTNAMLRTTTAPTMLSASTKENVLATEAIATVNFRLHPRDTPQDIIDFVTKTIDDSEVEVRQAGSNASPASPVSSPDTQGYRQIDAAIQAVYGPLATVPGLTIAATDTRHYALAADHAYRINPFKVTSEDIDQIHGINERISLENLKRGIEFYTLLLRGQ